MFEEVRYGPSRADLIASQNDRFRRDLLAGVSTVPGRYLLTRGVRVLSEMELLVVAMKVASFSEFEPGNDPYGEHDFGAVEVAGERFFWKIDYYDVGLARASSDPADLGVTVRVLTIMHADEY